MLLIYLKPNKNLFKYQNNFKFIFLHFSIIGNHFTLIFIYFILEKNNLNKTQITPNWKYFQRDFQFDSFKLPTHISYDLKKSFYLLSWKSLSCIKFPNLKYFQMEFKSFRNPFSFIKWKKSYHLHSRVLWWNEFEFMEIINVRWKFGKVISFPLI